MAWTADEKERVFTLAETGMSATEIAAALTSELKRPVSRNAILGIFNRAGRFISALNGGIQGRPGKRSAATKPRRAVSATTKAIAPVESQPIEVIIDELNPALNAPLSELDDNQCHWMVDDVAKLYCGAPVVSFRKSYCSIHAARARGHLKSRQKAEGVLPYRRARGRWT